MSTRSKLNDGSKAFLWHLAFLPVACLYVVCFWQLASPTHKNYVGFDSACFYMIGNGILHGKMPYIDYIDNKGPVTYLLYALIARIGHYPWCVMVLGVFCVFLSLAGLYALCRRLNIRRFYLLQILYLCFYALICPEGGITEDLAIPFCIWTFVVLADFLQTDAQGGFRFRYGLFIGLLFWLCALTRVNNAVSIAAAAVCIGLRLLFRKEFKSFGTLILSFAVGSVAALAPIGLWLAKHHALQEALNQVLLNNFKYGEASDAMSKREIFLSGEFGLRFFLLVGFCALCILISLRPRRDDCVFLRRSALLITGVTVLSCLSFTQNYSHYLLCMFPALLFCLTLPFACRDDADKAKKYPLRAVAVALCVPIAFVAFSGALTVKNGFWYAADIAVYVLKRDARETQEDWKVLLDEMTAKIPDEDRDSVFGVDISPKWFIYSDLEPCRRMFVCPTLFTSISPEYAAEFHGYFENDPPKWLIVSTALDDDPISGFDETLAEKYRQVDAYVLNDKELMRMYQLEVVDNG